MLHTEPFYYILNIIYSLAHLYTVLNHLTAAKNAHTTALDTRQMQGSNR